MCSPSVAKVEEVLPKPKEESVEPPLPEVYPDVAIAVVPWVDNISLIAALECTDVASFGVDVQPSG